MKAFHAEGYELIRGVFTFDELEVLRVEADRVADLEGSVCVRHLRAKSERISRLAASERIQKLLPRGLFPVRSILFDKTSDTNWPVAWHQDLTIAVKERVEIEEYGPWSIKDGSHHVQPPEDLLKQMITVRLHLDDTARTNGALRVIRGSHLSGKIPSKQILSHVNKSEVVCECQAGDVLLMSPLLLHASNRSEVPNRRRIIHFEYAPPSCLDGRLSWHEPQLID